MKKCTYCGAELPDEANFCPYCARSQAEKETVSVPVPKRNRIIRLAGILLIVLAAAFLIYYHTRPKVIDNGTAEAVYHSGDSAWHFLLRNTVNDDFHWQTAQGTFSRMCTAGTQGAVPLQLYVYDEKSGDSAAGEFLRELSGSELAAVPRGDAEAMVCTNPETKPGFPIAALEADIVFDTYCGTNDITWTLHLKNRDTVVLHEVVEILTSPEKTYSWKDVPLSTTAEVQAFLDQIDSITEDPNTVVTLELAPVVYEGDLDIRGRAVSLTGSSGEGGSTVIRGCVSIDTRNPLFATFSGITFEGPGTGILATEGLWLKDCVFDGKDTGILGLDGSWPIIEFCSFKGCGIGLHFNSSSSTMRNAFYEGLSFINNGTGVLLEKVPGNDTFYFMDCTFEENGTDIENHTKNEILYSLDGPENQE